MLKRIATICTLAALVVTMSGTAATAATDKTVTVTVLSSSGGARTTAIVDLNATAISTAVTCDEKPDGHHAHGTIQVKTSAGGSWVTEYTGNDYNGSGTCAALDGSTKSGICAVKVTAQTVDDGTGYKDTAESSTWSDC